MSSTSECVPPSPPAARRSWRLASLRLANRRHLLIGATALTAAGLTTGAGAAAAWESGTVRSYWQGLWWCLSLLTTEGFLGTPPHTAVGAVLSVLMMLTGFLLLALVGAAFASLFVREDERPDRLVDQHAHDQLLTAVQHLTARLEQLEGRP